MKTSADKTIPLMNDLIETCRDGQQGYATAAKEANEADLGRLFGLYEAQRRTFIGELQARVRALGGDPEKQGSVSGSLHRGWLDLRAALTTNESHAVLGECERGEDSAVANYRTALESGDLDSETWSLVERQAVGVQAAHDRIKQLRDSVAYAHR